MRKAALTLIFALSACSSGATGASSPPLVNAPLTPLSILYEYVPQSSPSTATPIVLYDQQFLDFLHDAYLLTTAPAIESDTHWSITGAAATLSQQQPFTGSIPGDPAPTASPGTIFIQGDAQYGKVTVIASVGNGTASITAIHYKSLSFGCQFRYTPAFAFDPDRVALMNDQQNWTSADAYVTAPSANLGPLDPCLGTQLATGTSVVWHVPAGGTLVPVSTLQDFVKITPAMWKNDGTAFAPTQADALLLKTAEGRIVKLMPPIGPYEVSQNGSFVLP